MRRERFTIFVHRRFLRLLHSQSEFFHDFCVLKFPAKMKARSAAPVSKRAARQLGWMRVAGIDEAGTRRAVGPVVCRRCDSQIPNGALSASDDSKNFPVSGAPSLPRGSRNHSLAWAVAEKDAQRIDAWNIYQASRQA